jgi:tRNA(Ile)-lysidine synthase
MLIEQFQQFVSKNNLFTPGDKLLLAVSGGVDSMVLLHLCIKMGYAIEVAHCNFKLRGTESDADEQLVATVCEAHQIKLHSTSFDTAKYAEQHKLSVQMAARELRYNYFNRLIEAHGFNFLLMAHHADDSIETFFINLIRSSGIEGLTGIALQNGNKLRPLLFASRADIETYARENQISYHQDSSNDTDDYLRNYLRHQVIPPLQNATAHAREGILSSLKHLQQDANLLNELFAAAIEKIAVEKENNIIINRTQLTSYSHAEALLFRYLKHKGFRFNQVQEMVKAEVNHSGKIFRSGTHRVLINRDQLILSAITTGNNIEECLIDTVPYETQTPLPLKIRRVKPLNIAFTQATQHEAFIDEEKITWPLSIRKWQAGDMMQPLGMKHRKKISDMLIDMKVDVWTKEKTYVLIDAAGNILWLIGYRMSELCKVTLRSNSLLHLQSAITQQ